MDEDVLERLMFLKASCVLWLCGAGLLSQGIPCRAEPAPLLGSAPAGQSRTTRRPDPQAQLLDYYRRYPDRYILVSNQTWKYDFVVRAAIHSFTLRNTASVGYCDIEVSFAYQASSGKTLQTQVVKVQGILEALRTLDVRRVKVKGAPDSSESVLVSVVRATVCR
jgi:hypothetical protein